MSVFITVISGHDKPQPPGCLLDAAAEQPESPVNRVSELLPWRIALPAE
ncbi:hypothetical protein [Escherichia coli]|nr:hypothetical protein [Escherichia coli]